MIEVPVEIEDALVEFAPKIGGSALTTAIVERSRRYTSERDRLAAPAGAADLTARALFFTIADVPKAIAILREVPIDWHAKTPLRIADLGAGAGAMSLGAIAHAAAIGATRPLAIEAIDRDTAALAILAHAVPAAAAALGVTVTVTTHGGDLRAPPADLVFFGSVLNELADPEPIVRAALAAADTVIIVEPALRETSRRLHELRATLIGTAHVFAPCTHEHACPMLADERDWCHEERVARLPPRATRLAQVTGLRDGAVKFAYLVLRRDAGHVGREGDLRVVGHPTSSKGKHELPACGPQGLVELRLLARHRVAGNKSVERARRGDLLRITPAPAAAGRSDLVADTAVAIVPPDER